MLLDGVGELSERAQARIFEALESQSIVRLGGREERPIDVRVLAATHRDLPAEVAAKRFREDLYYALSAFTVQVPPLRERIVEIDLFAHLFALGFAARAGQIGAEITPDASALLAKYDWPGNVTELRDAITHGVAMATRGRIDGMCLPDVLRRRSSRSRVR
jgi:DNA-binding NtrC family response regulator